MLPLCKGIMSKYDDLETTAQRVYKYLLETLGDKPAFVRYAEIAKEIDRTRSGVRYAVGVLLRSGKISIKDGKIAVNR